MKKSSPPSGSRQASLTGADAVEITVAGIAGLVPVIGGAIVSILQGTTTARRFARVEDTAQATQANLERLGESVAEEYVKSEDFEDLLFDAFEASTRMRHHEMRVWMGRFIANVAIKAPEYELAEEVRRVLLVLQPVHMQ